MNQNNITENIPMIEVRNVTMRYTMNVDRITSLKEYVIKLLKKDLEYEYFTALDNVSFTVRKGASMGARFFLVDVKRNGPQPK